MDAVLYIVVLTTYVDLEEVDAFRIFFDKKKKNFQIVKKTCYINTVNIISVIACFAKGLNFKPGVWTIFVLATSALI